MIWKIKTSFTKWYTRKNYKFYFDISKGHGVWDCLTTEELAAIESLERLISGLVDLGWEYDQIKEFVALHGSQVKRLVA